VSVLISTVSGVKISITEHGVVSITKSGNVSSRGEHGRSFAKFRSKFQYPEFYRRRYILHSLGCPQLPRYEFGVCLIIQTRRKLKHYFHEDKQTNLPLISWPVYRYAYSVLIGGFYPNTNTEWDYGMTSVAAPVTQASRLLKGACGSCLMNRLPKGKL